MCDCMDNQPEFYDVDLVVARKEHKCFECGSAILKGDRYERYTGKWDFGIETFKTCGPCVQLRDEMRDGDCFAFGELAQAVLDAKSFGCGTPEMDTFESRREAALAARSEL